MEETLKIKEGGIWEDKEFEIKLNYRLGKYDNTCKHVKNGVLKAVVIATNEGGHNSTGICCECLSESLARV